MISYCPLEEESPKTHKTVIQEIKKVEKKIETSLFNGEDTECNYLVMFFIFGVFLLAVSDQVRK
jgi:hypothetical protein